MLDFNKYKSVTLRLETNDATFLNRYVCIVGMQQSLISSKLMAKSLYTDKYLQW